MMAIMELSRGHNESAIKSQRVSAAWDKRRADARGRRGVLTKRLPAWVEEKGGRLVAVPERAETVKRIFDLCIAGNGTWATMKKFVEEKVPPFGPSGRWSVAYLDLILKDKRATGAYQPRKRRGGPIGDPIDGYFPRVVSDEVFERARAAARQRHRKPGRVTDQVNIFQGLLRGARDGMTYAVQLQTDVKGRPPYRVLRSVAPRSGAGSASSFPLPVFERAFLTCLKEINPQVIIGDDAPDEAPALAERLADVEARIGAVEEQLLEGDVAALTRVLRQLEVSRKDIIARLVEARRRAANPVTESWAEAKSLLEVLDSAPDPKEARLRLRSALRQIVEEVRLFVVKRGATRICMAGVYFRQANRARYYIIGARRPSANPHGRKPGLWWCSSFVEDDKAKLKILEMRDPTAEQLKAMEAAVPIWAYRTGFVQEDAVVEDDGDPRGPLATFTFDVSKLKPGVIGGTL
jgi:hypothetical protein